MRAVWSGAVQFGLVTIPVKMYSATDSQQLSFTMLHEKDRAQISYRRFCTEEDVEVPYEEIVKGLEIDGRMYVFSKQELEELRPQRSETIEVVRFVPAQAISSLFFDKQYFLGPEKQSRKPYALFLEALRESGRVAIGRVVIRTKEYTVALGAHREGLLLTTLLYPYEIRDISAVPGLADLPAAEGRQMELARELVDRFSEDRPALDEFEDTFFEALKRRIAQKEEGEVVEARRPAATKDEELLEALRASLSS